MSRVLAESGAVCLTVAVSRVVAVSRLRPGGSTVWHEQERETETECRA